MSVTEKQSHWGEAFTAVASPWTGRDARQLKRRHTETVWLNSSHGFQETTLELVRDLPATVTSVAIVARWIEDLKPLYDLGQRLTSLQLLVAPGASIDLSRFPALTSLSADWSTVEESLLTATGLEDLYLGCFTEKDLTSLSPLKNLSRLRMKDRPSVASLEGLDALVSLRSLTITGGRNLADITGLEGPVGARLEALDLDSCRRIQDLKPLSHCRSLKTLGLGNIGDVPSASPLAGLKELRGLFLHESTRFIDGDLSAIDDLHHLNTLGLMNRRHYHPNVQHLQANISRNRPRADVD